MIQKVLSAIGGVGVYGVIAVLLFFAVFLGVLAWALLLRRPYLERMSHLPLEGDDPPTPVPVRSSSPATVPNHE